MNRLVDELVRGILGEDMTPRKETVGIFAGGFKPPTLGHFSVIQKAIEGYPEMDRVIVYVGSGERDSINQKESIAVWRIYQKYLPAKVEIQPSPEGKPPVGKVYSYAKNNPDKNVYMLVGSREGNAGDEKDFAGKVRKLTSKPEEYPNLTAKKIDTGDGISGTKARKTVLDKNKEAFFTYIPDIPEKEEIWDMLSEAMGIMGDQNSVEPNYKLLAKKGAHVFHNGKKMFLKRRKFYEVKGIIEDRYTLEDKQGRQYWISKADMDNKWTQYDPEELKKGIEVEKEHTDNPRIAMKIALDHLDEDPKYYTKLATLGLEEYLDPDDVEDLDNLADRELNPIDVDLSGNHFFDRLNDPRNRPEINYLELEDFFTKLGDNREEFIDFLNKYKSVVATDNQTNINIPFMKMANKAIAKTIMRKKNFKTPNVKVELEEKLTIGNKEVEKINKIGNNPEDWTITYVDGTEEPYLQHLSEEISQDVIDSFDIQNTLVPEVWDGEELKPEIREKLLEIAQDFFESLELPKGTKLKDIKLTGSLANYNWSKFSDFDLHLVLDFSDIDNDEEFVRNYFMAKKGIWNDTHDITIYDFPVEVYVENEGESHTASGLYSILNDEWIVIPKKQEVMIDKDDISTKAQDYISQTEEVQKLYDEKKYEEVITKVDKIKERLRNMRSSGLEKGGEYSVENLAFKVLRRADIIGQLNDLKSKSYDTMMSLNEGMEEDLATHISSLTDYMANNGLNLKPYPELEYIEDDLENSANVFGKTAYYMPSEKKIVLYTLDRHPKDVLRSYAHELIHHHQNLNGTLNHSNTTNTNEDDALDAIEREAYELGNINFRNWEDAKK